MPHVPVGDLRLFHDTDGDGEPLLLLPGLGDDHRSFALLRPELARRHRLVLVDHRDAGASDEAPGPYGLADVARDALGVLDALGVARVHVLGYSMGGAVAQHLALQAPERVASLVLLHTWGRTDAFLRAVFESWRLLIERLSPEEFLAMQAPWVFNARFLAAPPPQVVAMQRDDLARGWPRSTAALQRQLDACIAHDVLQALVILQTPTLVLVGEDDILTPPRYGRALAAMLGRADLAVVPGAAHGGPFEAPKAVAERALEFLARQARRAGAG